MAEDQEDGFNWVGEDHEIEEQSEYQNNTTDNGLERWETDEEARNYLERVWADRDQRGGPAYDETETLLSDVLQDVDLFDTGSGGDTQAGASVWRERSMSPDNDDPSDTEKYRMMKAHVETYLQENVGDVEIEHDGDTYTADDIAETVAAAFYKNESPGKAADISKEVGRQYGDETFTAIVGLGLKEKYQSE